MRRIKCGYGAARPSGLRVALMGWTRAVTDPGSHCRVAYTIAKVPSRGDVSRQTPYLDNFHEIQRLKKEISGRGGEPGPESYQIRQHDACDDLADFLCPTWAGKAAFARLQATFVLFLQEVYEMLGWPRDSKVVRLPPPCVMRPCAFPFHGD